MSREIYSPEAFFEGRRTILHELSIRGAESMDEQRGLVAQRLRATNGEEIKELYGDRGLSAYYLGSVIDGLAGVGGRINSKIAVDPKLVDAATWVNPRGDRETSKMAIKNMGVAKGEVMIYERGQAAQTLLDMLPGSGVSLLYPVLVLAYGFETNFWGSHHDTLAGVMYQVAFAWTTWNSRPGNIHSGEYVYTEGVWDGKSQALIVKTTNQNICRSQRAHVLEYFAKANPYSGGLPGQNN